MYRSPLSHPEDWGESFVVKLILRALGLGFALYALGRVLDPGKDGP